MKTRTKVLISIIAVVLSALLITTIVLLAYGKSVNQLVRTVELTSKGLDVRETLNNFENTKYSKNGTTTIIEASKKIKAEDLSNIETISLNKEEIEGLAKGTIKYNVSYDTENNKVILSAIASFPDGKLEVEEITGMAFLNENSEIDAVMNVDGEGVLLSEMRASGMIENCGWFSRLIRKFAVAVAVVATVVAVGAVIVATAGALAPVAVAAGIGASTTVVASIIVPTAIIVAKKAALIASIAMGVAIAASVWEAEFPDVEFNTTTQPTTGEQMNFASGALEKVLEVVIVAVLAAIKENPELPKKFFQVIKLINSEGPIKVITNKGYTQSEMASRMKYAYWNSITAEPEDARAVLLEAFPKYGTILHGKGLYHYHPYVNTGNPNNVGGVLINGHSIHSYCYIKPLEEPKDNIHPKIDLDSIVGPYYKKR